MARHHDLKLRHWLCEDVMDGRKRIEVRKDDRLFQAGDTVTFEPVGESGMRVSDASGVSGRTWRITFVEHGFGLRDGFCAFCFEAAGESARSVPTRPGDDLSGPCDNGEVKRQKSVCRTEHGADKK